LSAVFEIDISCQGYGYTNRIMNSFYRTVSFISTLTHETIFDLQPNVTACTEGICWNDADMFKCTV